MMALDDDHMALVLDGARCAPDLDRDDYFRAVAARLRPVVFISDEDVRAAVNDALGRRRRA